MHRSAVRAAGRHIHRRHRGGRHHVHHNNGAFGKKYLPETIGAGVRVPRLRRRRLAGHVLRQLDELAGAAGARRRCRRSIATTTTARSRTSRGRPAWTRLYGLGVAAADYDNDGDDRHLRDRARRQSALPQPRRREVRGRHGARPASAIRGFSTSAAWFDYDNDGKLDLFVAQLRRVDGGEGPLLHARRQDKSYCTPSRTRDRARTLFRNNGDGTFEDVTRKAGLYDPTSKALGVALLDYDDDGWLDLFVANDTQPNHLYRNNGNGTFTESAMTAGVAFNEAGVARAGMGVDAADYDGSGRQSLIIGNFSNEMMALYQNEGTGLFIDEAPTSTIGKASLLTLTFACFFFDYDLDGLLDIFAANGHVADDIAPCSRASPTRSRRISSAISGSKKFEANEPRSGRRSNRPVVARGAAYGDFDNDGDLDLVDHRPTTALPGCCATTVRPTTACGSAPWEGHVESSMRSGRESR